MKVDPRQLRLPDAEPMALQIAAGRTAFAALFLAAPVVSVRLLGTDTATAKRVAWLTRMMAVRDGALGVGAALAGRRSAASPWLFAGAVSDAVDAIVIAGALKQGRLKGIVATLTVPLAGGTAVVGAVTALRLRRLSATARA